MNNRIIPSLYSEFKLEAVRLKYYTQTRFKDITSSIKQDLPFACASFLALAWSVYLITLPIFIFSASTIIVLDYLNNTYPKKPYVPFSISLWRLFSEIKILETHQPLSSEDRHELAQNPDDVELLELLEKWDQQQLDKQTAYKNDTRPVFLFLKAKSDHNGALDLYDKDSAVTINGDNNKGVKKLREKYKIVIIDNVKNVHDIENGLNKITNTIQHVWFLAHGTPTSMQLDGQFEIRNSDLDDLADVLQKKLAKDAHVILYSCSTGKEISSGDNIAIKFSKILPGRTIWAPKLPTGVMTLNLGNDFSMKVNFLIPKTRLNYLFEKIRNICCLCPLKKIKLDSNVTTQVKDGIALT